MPQDPLATPRREKTKASDRNRPANKPTATTMELTNTPIDTTQDSLAQLKKTILNKGGLIKNTTDAKKFLASTGLTPQDTTFTPGNCVQILLTLVATSYTKRTASDKIPEKVVNIIKATALLLNDISTTSMINETVEAKTGHTTTPYDTAIQDLKTQMETNLDLLKNATTSQAEATDKTNALLARMEKICEQSEKSLDAAWNTTSATPYRDALVHGRNNTTPQTHTQLRILNHINIKSCQVLIEFKPGALDKFNKADQPTTKPTNLIIKDAVNTWLNAPEDQNGPLPRNAITKALATYGNNRMMLEMNSAESATWMHTHPERILGNILKCPVKVITRTYVIVARFVLITFDTTPASLRELEEAMELPSGTIQEASWIKHPSKRAVNQKYANLKILCTTPEGANTLINGPTYILGSRISIQKDIRSPGVCNKCQSYSHMVRDCKATMDTCRLCGKNHRTSTCRERDERKCTPCGSTDHPTNHMDCLIYRQHEKSMIDRNPETISPYYLTNKDWSWGPKLDATDTLPPPADTCPPRLNTNHGNRTTCPANPPPTGLPP